MLKLGAPISGSGRRAPRRSAVPKPLLTKEPGTIAWIEGFTEDDVFWDVGANVGLYSLYAGIDDFVSRFGPPFFTHIKAAS